jgi:hypothetical protein
MPTKNDGYITQDDYAAVPWSNKLVIVHNGEQIGEVENIRESKKFIEDHREKISSIGVFFV